MGTFRKTEMVDARQLTGGAENAKMIIQWIKAADQRLDASWRREEVVHFETEGQMVVNKFERLTLTVPNTLDYPIGETNDWIVKGEDGQIEIVKPDVFAAKYEQM